MIPVRLLEETQGQSGLHCPDYVQDTSLRDSLSSGPDGEVSQRLTGLGMRLKVNADKRKGVKERS